MSQIIVREIPEFRLGLDPETQAHHTMIDLQYDLADLQEEGGMESWFLEQQMREMVEKRRQSQNSTPVITQVEARP